MSAAAPLLAVLLAAGAPPAAGEVTLAPAVVRPGDTVLVRVRVPAGAAEPRATLAGRQFQLWRRGDERWAVAALPLETPPGPVLLEVSAGGEPRVATLEVIPPGFASRTLRVAPQFVEPPPRVKARIERDRRAFAAAYARPFVPPLFSGSFGWPRRAATTGRFGDQRVFNGKMESVHYGLDLVGPRGAPVRAANDGEVVLARDCFYSGKTVVLWHGADLFTLYFHLDRVGVSPGAKVKKGDRIGSLGSTGRSTGPHLHWSARAAGLLVDPESLLAIDFARGAAAPRLPAPAPPKAAEPPEAVPAEAPAEATPAGVAPPEESPGG